MHPWLRYGRLPFLAGFVAVILLCGIYWPIDLFTGALIGMPVLAICRILESALPNGFWALRGFNLIMCLCLDKLSNQPSPADVLAALDVADYEKLVACTTLTALLIHVRRRRFPQESDADRTQRIQLLQSVFVGLCLTFGVVSFVHWVQQFNSFTPRPTSLLPKNVVTLLAMISTAATLQSWMYEQGFFWKWDEPLPGGGRSLSSTLLYVVLPRLIVTTACALDLASTAAVVASWTILRLDSLLL